MQKPNYRADDRLNQLNDQDEMWGPLLFLRPARHQLMRPLRVLAICGSLGLFYGMLGNVVLGLLARSGGGYQPPVVMMPLLLTSMYFVCAQLSIVGAWNRRARLLSRRMGWGELTGRPLPPTRDDEQAAE
jgi:hypothetical protein